MEGNTVLTESAPSLALRTRALKKQILSLRASLHSEKLWKVDRERHQRLHKILRNDVDIRCLCETNGDVYDEAPNENGDHLHSTAASTTTLVVRSPATKGGEHTELGLAGELPSSSQNVDIAFLAFLRQLFENEDVRLPMSCFALRDQLVSSGFRALTNISPEVALTRTVRFLKRAAKMRMVEVTKTHTGYQDRRVLMQINRAAIVSYVVERALQAPADFASSSVGKSGATSSGTPTCARLALESATHMLLRPKDEVFAAPKSRALEASHEEHEGVIAQDEIEALLGAKTFSQKKRDEVSDEIYTLCTYQSVGQRVVWSQFRLPGIVAPFCEFPTREDCKAVNGNCEKLHFQRVKQPQTDPNMGDCSYLNGCFNMKACKQMHYELDAESKAKMNATQLQLLPPDPATQFTLPARKFLNLPTFYQYPPQWINCDVRNFDYSILGKFGVVMADPAWAIHMDLPYGTMEDDEMRHMNIPVLQDDGFIFLWVTMRALELARDCLDLWGYRRIDELIWVKTNQLQQLIRVGRTGHWLNHSKEHCLVGVKGNPKGFNALLDTDVLVAELRATSRKPDEMYGLVERFFPGSRKIELFGRAHNCNPGWVTLGNQLEGTRIIDPDLRARYNARYPETAV